MHQRYRRRRDPRTYRKQYRELQCRNWVHISENIAWFYEAPYPVTDWTNVLTDKDMKAFAKDFFLRFKNSSIHYENILYREFTETGFGVVIIITNDGTLKAACSQLFGTPA